MSNRSAKFVSVLFAGILAGANFAAVAENGAQSAENGTKAADNCLSGPKGAAPAGSHWYYRIDRPTKRQCWYLGEAKNTTTKNNTTKAVARRNSSSSASVEADNPVPPQQTAAASKTVANAHAEWPAPQSSAAQDASVTGTIPVADNRQPAIAPESTQSSLIASRWPGSSEESSSSNPRLAADPAASPQPDETAPEQPAVSPVALAAANSALEKPSGSPQTLLMVIASALAFAGLIGTVIFRFGRSTPVVLAEVRDDRRAPWDSIHSDRPPRPMFANEEAPVRRADPAHDPRAPDDPERRIAEMLARLSRSATA
jgi:hypothetical protein